MIRSLPSNRALIISALFPVVLSLPQGSGAQDHCDSLDILHVRYHPFFDSVVNAHVHNTGTQFFSGPQFNLVNEQGDTIARQQFEFFGISNVPQTQHMQLQPSEQLPTSPFTGSLVLYAYVDEPDTCTWEVDTDLCPPDSCTPLNVYLFNFGSPPFSTSFTWQVHDSLHATVASGTLEINVFGEQQDLADLCLPPGRYELHVQQAEDIGVQYAIGVSQGGDMFINSGPSTTLQPGGQAVLPFEYYTPCISSSNGIGEHLPPAPTLLFDGRTLRITSADGAPLGSLFVVDAAGRGVLQLDARSSSTTLDLSGAPAGMYLVRTVGSPWPARRFILH